MEFILIGGTFSWVLSNAEVQHTIIVAITQDRRYRSRMAYKLGYRLSLFSFRTVGFLIRCNCSQVR
ncbi:hypothetical protein [Zobellella maritima]|uniref:hypothetical protein n=1 Tax=Zobellella maritima TaxID=2059725 RepID=UPI000E30438D|nr:hypothetical protein [Zobellella maritima]